jgi:hypothetical protein
MGVEREPPGKALLGGQSTRLAETRNNFLRLSPAQPDFSPSRPAPTSLSSVRRPWAPKREGGRQPRTVLADL